MKYKTCVYLQSRKRKRKNKNKAKSGAHPRVCPPAAAQPRLGGHPVAHPVAVGQDMLPPTLNGVGERPVTPVHQRIGDLRVPPPPTKRPRQEQQPGHQAAGPRVPVHQRLGTRPTATVSRAPEDGGPSVFQRLGGYDYGVQQPAARRQLQFTQPPPSVRMRSPLQALERHTPPPWNSGINLLQVPTGIVYDSQARPAGVADRR